LQAFLQLSIFMGKGCGSVPLTNGSGYRTLVFAPHKDPIFSIKK